MRGYPTESIFFSSRRRTTRYIGDWSSDVCSSDLDRRVVPAGPRRARLGVWPHPRRQVAEARAEIGRASCRERKDGCNIVNRSRKTREAYKVKHTINASLNTARSTRAVSSRATRVN